MSNHAPHLVHLYEADGDEGFYDPPGEPLSAKPNKFRFESVADILTNFGLGQE